MCGGLIGRKLGMTGVFSENGEYVPVTVIETGPCVVTQIKTVAKDGYNSLQLAFGQKKESRLKKPILGHVKKAGKGGFSFLKEFPVDNPEDYSLGQVIPVNEVFEIGSSLDISGKIKGRGFSGVMKRHGFSGGRKTHGSHCVRIPGSVGCSAWPAKIIRGKKMPGRYGNEKRTIKNLKVIDIRPEDNLLLVKGAVPGHRSSILELKKKK